MDEQAKDAELRRAIVRRIAGEVATKRDLEELRNELEARISSVEQSLRREIKDVEDKLRRELNDRIDRLHERIDRLQAQLDARIDRLHERIDRLTRWVIVLAASTWATLTVIITKLLV